MTKIQQLEERLSDKQEQLLEKELILEEVTQLSGRLRVQAAEGRGETLELAKRVNDYQAKIRRVTRRMMATVSELSMYQASSMRLVVEKEGLEDVLEEAKQRLQEGEAPTPRTRPRASRTGRSASDRLPPRTDPSRSPPRPLRLERAGQNKEA